MSRGEARSGNVDLARAVDYVSSVLGDPDASPDDHVQARFRAGIILGLSSNGADADLRREIVRQDNEAALDLRPSQLRQSRRIN